MTPKELTVLEVLASFGPLGKNSNQVAKRIIQGWVMKNGLETLEAIEKANSPKS